MPPFMGPMTTGTPKPKMAEGAFGETGIGWWMTSTPVVRISCLMSRRWRTSSKRLIKVPKTASPITFGILGASRHSARWIVVSST